MRGQQHIQISVFTGLIITTPFLLSYPELSILFLAGLFLGSLLPDSDASDRTAKHKESVLFAFDRINEILIYPLLLKIFYENKKHRGILHTISGVFVFSLIFTIITGIVFYIFKIQFSFIIFGIGIFVGGIFHLMEDCCTVSGVNPFYPKFKNYVFKGNVSTFAKNENRPDRFSEYLGVLFVVLISIQIFFHISQQNTILLVTIAVILSWTVFFKLCGVKKKHN